MDQIEETLTYKGREFPLKALSHARKIMAGTTHSPSTYIKQQGITKLTEQHIYTAMEYLLNQDKRRAVSPAVLDQERLVLLLEVQRDYTLEALRMARKIAKLLPENELAAAVLDVAKIHKSIAERHYRKETL